MSTAFVVVIPARYASTRLPAKPLCDIGGLPMVVRVARRAAQTGASRVVIATDDRRVLEKSLAFGIDTMMTRPSHRSGSDRVMEVVSRLGLDEDSIVVNVQGDEPLIPPAAIMQVARRLHDHPSFEVATLCEPITERAELFNPNVVKVVREASGRALYFSRAPIPWWRDAFTGPHAESAAPLQRGTWWRHIGIYGYRARALRRFCALAPATEEILESLEQLRLLANGIPIAVDETVEPVPGGIDTPEDLERVRRLVGGV